MTAALEAAARLAQTCPVRTHYQDCSNPAGNAPRPHNGGNNRKRVVIGRTSYDSLSDAAKAVGRSPKFIYGMIRRGEAELA